MKSISVIIPIYNTEEYVRECLDSVAQLAALEDIEVIMVDDGSTDQSGEIARSYAAEHEAFRYFRKENEGQGKARNFGIEQAGGKYLLFVDSDDLIVADVYSEMLRIAEHNEADITTCAFTRFRNGKIKASALSPRVFYDNTAAFPTDIEKSPMFVFDTISCNKLIRRSFMEEFGIRYPVGVLFEDVITMMQLHVHARRCAVCRKTGYIWRSRNNEKKSTTQKVDEFHVFDDKLAMTGKSIDYYREHRGEDEGYHLLQWKTFATDLKRYLQVLYKLPEEEGMRYVERMADFIDQYAERDILERMPAVFPQIFDDIRRRDLTHLIKVVNYWHSSYRTIPYLYGTDGDVRLRLSSELFDQTECSARNELTEVPPKCAVQEVYEERGRLHIRGYLHQHKVQTSDGYPQQIEAFLTDHLTGEQMRLHSETVETGGLTREKGLVICNDDHVAYEYDYDRSGFDISIDLSSLEAADGFSGDSAIMIYHKNLLSEGTQIVGGVPAALKKRMKKWEYKGERVRFSWYVDRTGAPFLRKEPYEKEKVSVILSVDEGRTESAAQCLKFIREQSWNNLEILLTGAGKAAKELLAANEKSDRRLRLLGNRSGSAADVLRAAVTAAAGEYIVFAESADRMSQHYVRRMVELAEQNSVPLARSSVVKVQKQKKKPVYPEPKEAERVKAKNYRPGQWKLSESLHGIIFRADILKAAVAGLSAEDDGYSARTALFAGALSKAGVIACTDSPLCSTVVTAEDVENRHTSTAEKLRGAVRAWDAASDAVRSDEKGLYPSVLEQDVRCRLKLLKYLADSPEKETCQQLTEETKEKAEELRQYPSTIGRTRGFRLFTASPSLYMRLSRVGKKRPAEKEKNGDETQDR